MLFLAAFSFHPFFQTRIVDILNTSSAFAGRHQWIIFRGFVYPAEPAEWQFFIHAHAIGWFVVKLNIFRFIFIAALNFSYFSMVASIHFSYYILII